MECNPAGTKSVNTGVLTRQPGCDHLACTIKDDSNGFLTENVQSILYSMGVGLNIQYTKSLESMHIGRHLFCVLCTTPHLD